MEGTGEAGGQLDDETDIAAAAEERKKEGEREKERENRTAAIFFLAEGPNLNLNSCIRYHP